MTPLQAIRQYLAQTGELSLRLEQVSPTCFRVGADRLLAVAPDGAVRDTAVSVTEPAWTPPPTPTIEGTPLPTTPKSNTSTPRVGKPANRNGRQDTLGSVEIDTLSIEPVEWLWTARVPMEEVTMIIGDPGTGKGHVVADIVARFTTERALPEDSVVLPKGRVIWIGTEDDNARTLKPRLMAARADLSLVTSVNESETFSFTLPQHTKELRALIEEKNAADSTRPVRLLVVDPLGQYADKGIDLNAPADGRKVLKVLTAIARDYHLAVLLVHHLNKSNASSKQKALYRAAGSLSGIVGAARSVLMVAVDPECPEWDQQSKVLAPVKHNLAKAPDSLSFGVTTATVTEKQRTFTTSRVEWFGVSQYSADELSSADSGDADVGARQAAKDFLLEFLGNGPRWTDDVYDAANKRQISLTGALRRASDELKVEKRWNHADEPNPGEKERKAWIWLLPPQRGKGAQLEQKEAAK